MLSRFTAIHSLQLRGGAIQSESLFCLLFAFVGSPSLSRAPFIFLLNFQLKFVPTFLRLSNARTHAARRMINRNALDSKCHSKLSFAPLAMTNKNIGDAIFRSSFAWTFRFIFLSFAANRKMAVRAENVRPTGGRTNRMKFLLQLTQFLSPNENKSWTPCSFGARRSQTEHNTSRVLSLCRGDDCNYGRRRCINYIFIYRCGCSLLLRRPLPRAARSLSFPFRLSLGGCKSEWQPSRA